MRLKLITVTALSALLAGPAAFAATEPQANGTAGNSAAQATAHSPWVTVTSVEDLVGRNLRDPQGHDAGQIHSIVVDMRSDQIAYAVIGSNGSFDLEGKYIAVPFSELKLPPSDDLMNVMVPADKLAKSKRMSESDIADFGKPQEIASRYSYYAVKPSNVTPAADTATPPSGDNQPYLLVRYDTIMQMNAGQHLASDMQGATVKDKSGKDLGEIDRIMVDPATGHVAYIPYDAGWLPSAWARTGCRCRRRR